MPILMSTYFAKWDFSILLHSGKAATQVCFIKLIIAQMSRVGQNRICLPYMAVCMLISLLEIPYMHRIYICMYGFGQPHK